VRAALSRFVRSLQTSTASHDDQPTKQPAKGDVDLGRRLFNGIAGCSTCHSTSGSVARFSDGQYHHSGIGHASQSPHLPELAEQVRRDNLDAGQLGPKILSDANWSSLGRYVVSHRPVDIGAFHTPSLRNVAVTAPYMHDGSIASLSEAVDHEIYYRGLSSGHPVNLTQSERSAIVSFLETLTDAAYVPYADNELQH